MIMTTIRAVVYARFSSTNQRSESIDAQKRACYKYISEGKTNIEAGVILKTPTKNIASHYTYWFYEGVERHKLFTVTCAVA